MTVKQTAPALQSALLLQNGAQEEELPELSLCQQPPPLQSAEVWHGEHIHPVPMGPPVEPPEDAFPRRRAPRGSVGGGRGGRDPDEGLRRSSPLRRRRSATMTSTGEVELLDSGRRPGSTNNRGSRGDEQQE